MMSQRLLSKGAEGGQSWEVIVCDDLVVVTVTVGLAMTLAGTQLRDAHAREGVEA